MISLKEMKTFLLEIEDPESKKRHQEFKKMYNQAKKTPPNEAERRIIKDHLHKNWGKDFYKTPDDIADGAYRGMTFGIDRYLHPDHALKIAREVQKETKIKSKLN